MLEPIRLPKTISEWWRTAATRLAASSGRLVPKATMVSPITRSLTPRWRATPTAPVTSRWAPSTSRPMPASTRPAASHSPARELEVAMRAASATSSTSTSPLGREIR